MRCSFSRFGLYSAAALLICQFAIPADAASVVEEWKRLPPKVLQCFRIAAEEGNNTLEAVIATGARPGEQRFAELMRTCEQYAKPMRDSFECDLKDQSGTPIRTLCREYYALVDGSQTIELNADDALRRSLSGQTVQIMLLETPEGLAARQAAIFQQLNNSPDVEEEERNSNMSSSSTTEPNVETDVQSKTTTAATNSDDDDKKVAELFGKLSGQWCGLELPLKISCDINQGCRFDASGGSSNPWHTVRWFLSDEGKLSVFRELTLNDGGSQTHECTFNFVSNEMHYDCVDVFASKVFGTERKTDSARWKRCGSEQASSDKYAEEVTEVEHPSVDAIKALEALSKGGSKERKYYGKCRSISVATMNDFDLVIRTDFSELDRMTTFPASSLPASNLARLACERERGEDAVFYELTSSNGDVVGSFSQGGVKQSDLDKVSNCVSSADVAEAKKRFDYIKELCRRN
jgi:hypothetical protein